MEQLFLKDNCWEHHGVDLYQCFISDVTADIAPDFQAEVLVRMREITGLPLIDHVRITAQRMLSGHAIGMHGDRPLLGYEIARLVV